jgi:thermostable 8-oxoguanine DNA glycosylase
MIIDGNIQAKIDQKLKMISFVDLQQHEASSADNSEFFEVVEELERQNKRIVELMKEVQKVDSGIKTSKQFIKRELTTENAKGMAGTSSSGGQSSGASQPMMM